MLIAGLTGSIGMGKTTVANAIAARGIPVSHSDAIVHDLYAGDAVPLVEAAFPGTTAGGKVDRAKLSKALGRSPDGFSRLETLIHPLVRRAQWRFIEQQHDAGANLSVLDVPLLFETGGDKLVDTVLVVSAPETVQAERVLARPAMTREKFETIRARQIPDAEKRARADAVIDTGLPMDETLGQLDRWLESVKGRSGDKYRVWRDLHSGTPGGQT